MSAQPTPAELFASIDRSMKNLEASFVEGRQHAEAQASMLEGLQNCLAQLRASTPAPAFAHPADASRAFDLAAQIDALYVGQPLAAGSFDQRGKIQALLMQAGVAIAPAKVTLPRVSREIWPNGSATTVPAALRFLAEHDRPSGGSDHYNDEHLYQLAGEVEAAVRATQRFELRGGKVSWVTCPICREDDMRCVEEDEGQLIQCVNLGCPSNQVVRR